MMVRSIRLFIFIVFIIMFMSGLIGAEESPFLRDARIKLANSKRIAIIPFTDYGRDPTDLESRRVLFLVRQGFESMGKLIIPDENVLKVLNDMGLIKRNNEYRESIRKQLQDYGFSKELVNYIEENDIKMTSEPYISALTEEQIKEIAKALNVDLIIRGSIVDYGVIDLSSANPLSTIIGGVAPFVTAQRVGVAVAAGSYIPSTDKEGVIQMTIFLHEGASGRLIYGKSVFATYKPLFSNLQGRFILMRGALKRALETFFSELTADN